MRVGGGFCRIDLVIWERRKIRLLDFVIGIYLVYVLICSTLFFWLFYVKVIMRYEN